MRAMTVVFSVMLLAGCASTPTAPSTTTAKPVPVTPASGAVVAPTAVAATTQSATAAGGGATQVAAVKAPAGYKAVERNGVMYFCQKWTPLGSRFKQEICLTEEEYEEVRRRGESVRTDLEKSSTICGVSASNACGMN